MTLMRFWRNVGVAGGGDSGVEVISERGSRDGAGASVAAKYPLARTAPARTATEAGRNPDVVRFREPE